MELKFIDGYGTTAAQAHEVLTPLFLEGVITRFPGAGAYCIAYSELCAYDVQGELMAVWSSEVPDSVATAIMWSKSGRPSREGAWAYSGGWNCHR